MAFKNDAIVYIDGINRTPETVMPVKCGNFLDERLDECVLSLRGTNQEIFAPLTPVEIRFDNELYWGGRNPAKRVTERLMQLTKYYVVANDVSEEMMIGRKLYRHELYLIEVTKIAECYVVDTITFTNSLGRDYTKNAQLAALDKGEYWYLTEEGSGEFRGIPENYITPMLSGKDFQIASFFDVLGKTHENTSHRGVVVYRDSEIFLKVEGSQERPVIENIQAGTYKIEYYSQPGSIYSDIVSFTITVLENRLPMKKWTITDVINRTLDLAEPLRQGEKSRFRLNGMSADGKIIPEGEDGAGQAARFDKVLSPEMSFTKQTLRECLQSIGKVIHGEPRLTPKKDGDDWYYEVSYDMYASQDQGRPDNHPYVKKTISQGIEHFASHLDSSAENLVNFLDKFSGVIVEPYAGGAKSMRTENMYVRIEEGNMIIPTQYPVYSVDKLEYVYRDKNEIKSVDITAYLFDKSVYNTQLSSYADRQYPNSKAYGLYYAQGEKNIGGLNFKVDDAEFAAYQNYSIINILRRELHDEKFSVSSYPAMSFRVTYTPFYNARVGQTKPYYKDFSRPAALIYNQQSNVIESRYYGENLKGAIARLGNIEKTFTYLMYNIKEIPKAGQMFDKDYCISVVAVEFLPTVIICSIGVSKDFNRISPYIGINSEKRYSEISQKQAVERNTLYREYIVIGKKEQPDNGCLMGDQLIAMIADTFTQNGGYRPLTNVCAWGTSYYGKIINNSAVNLPVISSAFGNSISFSWEYADNYSAGATSEYVTDAFIGKVSGYFQNDQPYTDYYGKLYHYNFDLQLQGPVLDYDSITEIPFNLPKGEIPSASSGYVSTIGQTPYVLRKDNREALQVNFQIDFVTNLENMIIGSALAAYCPAVRGTDARLAEARLYVFPTELNKFTDHVEAFEDVDLFALPSSEIEVETNTDYFMVKSGAFPAGGKSWAIVTKQYKKPEELVEDEHGNPSQQREVMGGDLLIGQNIEVTAGQAFTPIYFTKKREIFDKTVWKEKR